MVSCGCPYMTSFLLIATIAAAKLHGIIYRNEMHHLMYPKHTSFATVTKSHNFPTSTHWWSSANVCDFAKICSYARRGSIANMTLGIQHSQRTPVLSLFRPFYRLSPAVSKCLTFPVITSTFAYLNVAETGEISPSYTPNDIDYEHHSLSTHSPRNGPAMWMSNQRRRWLVGMITWQQMRAVIGC